MRNVARLAFWAVVCAGCSSSPAVSTCVPGSTQACLCVGGSSGVQSCTASGTFDACACVGTDGGPPSDVDAYVPPGTDAGTDVDAQTPPGGCDAPLVECGDRCVDTSTDEANCGGCGSGSTNVCATGSFCVSGTCMDVSGCPPPFVMCDADCIDPRSSTTHCGASIGCAGASAGVVCGGACVGGRCAYESCGDVVRAGASTGDGLYLVDVDGSGPTPPQDVYCDMTTEGGGWMLVYKIRNDIPDISDPWWGMVALGSGTAYPAAPTPIPSGAHFEGPTRAVRWAYFTRRMSLGYDLRATTITTTGARVVDVLVRQNGAVYYLASGQMGTPMPASAGSYWFVSQVTYAAPGLSLSTGAMVHEEYFPFSGSGDSILLRRSTGDSFPMAGDSSIHAYSSMLVDSTTLIWMRDPLP